MGSPLMKVVNTSPRWEVASFCYGNYSITTTQSAILGIFPVTLCCPVFNFLLKLLEM